MKLDDTPGNTFQEDSFYPETEACNYLLKEVDKVIQKDQLENGNVPVVIFTDPIIESEMQIALEDLANHPEILNSKIIRIEDL